LKRAALWAIAAWASCGCVSTPPSASDTSVALPSYDPFVGDAKNTGVHVFLERRCGTLDCHGQIGRPLRLFSSGGLRLPNDAGLAAGIGDDSPQEIYANYTSLVGVQPEETSQVVLGLDPPTALLVVAKPLLLQTHKGGAVLARGDSGDRCLETWLSGAVDPAACDDAALVP
jgi:hypothetical protein